MAVRAVCIYFLRYAMDADPIRACKLFKRLIAKDKEILGEDGTYDYLYHSLTRYADKVLWAIREMILQQNSDTSEAGAKLACLAAFHHPPAEALRDACLKGDVECRKGAAAVYSANIVNNKVGQESRQRILQFLNDEDRDVRREGTAFLRDLTAHNLREIGQFITEWAKSKSLDEGADHAAYMLREHSTAAPELTLNIAQRIIDGIGADITNIQLRHGGISHNLVPAILNIYHRFSDKALRSRAMDLFEKLEEMGSAEVYPALEAADRV